MFAHTSFVSVAVALASRIFAFCTLPMQVRIKVACMQVVKLHKHQEAAFDLLPWAKTESIALQSAWNAA